MAALDRVGAGGCVEVGVRSDGGRAEGDVLDDAPPDAAAAGSESEYTLASIALRIARQCVEARGGEFVTEERGPARRRATRVRLPLDG